MLPIWSAQRQTLSSKKQLKGIGHTARCCMGPSQLFLTILINTNLIFHIPKEALSFIQAHPLNKVAVSGPFINLGDCRFRAFNSYFNNS